MATIPDALATAIHLGNAHRECGDLAAAADCYRRALSIAPDDGRLLTNLGTVLAAQGNGAEALACFRAAAAALPDEALAHYNLGRALYDRGDLEGALFHCQRAVQLDPSRVNAHLNLGNVYRTREELPAAVDCYRRALAISPNQPTVLTNLGNVLALQAKKSEASECFRAALRASPDFVAAHFNLGALLLERGDLTGALPHLRKTAQLDPDNAESHFKLGCVLDQMNEFVAATESYEHALTRNPGHAQAHSNLGSLYVKRREPSMARASFTAAIAANSDLAVAHLGRAMADLQVGEWIPGWREYEWRWKLKDTPPALPGVDRPFWSGAPLHGARILLIDEQGLGDALQFVRYAPMVAARGGRVLLRVRAALRRLLKTVPRIAAISTFDEPLPAFEAYCPLLSLPHAFGTTPQTVPAAVPYLFADAARVVLWRERLGTQGFKVGVCWHGSAKKSGLGRSFPLRELKRIAGIPKLRLISLQKCDGLEELQTLPPGMRVETLGEDFDSGPDVFLDTAAVIENLDLVITCDTSIAHLAGAMGRATYVALQYAPDWRWMLERGDSLWYPTHRLFRQSQEGQWSDVFDSIHRSLS
jgi:tetratricopeptide (TPR) repeat protein